MYQEKTVQPTVSLLGDTDITLESRKEYTLKKQFSEEKRAHLTYSNPASRPVCVKSKPSFLQLTMPLVKSSIVVFLDSYAILFKLLASFARIRCFDSSNAISTMCVIDRNSSATDMMNYNEHCQSLAKSILRMSYIQLYLVDYHHNVCIILSI